LLGKWPPETRLRPAELAADLGVSASPVREALTRLSERGLVTSLDHLGFAVPRLDPLTVQHYYGLLARLYIDSIDRLAAVGLLTDVADKLASAVDAEDSSQHLAEAYLRVTAACRRLLLIKPYHDIAERLGDVIAAHAAQAGAVELYTSSLGEIAALPAALRQGGAAELRSTIRTYFKRRAAEITQAIARRAGLPVPPSSGRDHPSR
jgi:DNA-binding GntR family transcriptional regulator